MRVREVMRDAAAGAMAGLAVGVLVGGLGSRLVMRISAIAAGPAAEGLQTANGNIVGEITLGGTVGLLIFGGAFSGLLGGLLYAALRPWLEPFGRSRGLVFGIGLFALIGSLVVDSDNIDFALLRPASLNVAMFVALFPIFGLALVPAFDFVKRLLSRDTLMATALTGAGALLAAFFVVTSVISTREALAGRPTRSDLLIFGTTAIIVLGLVVRWSGVDARPGAAAGKVAYAALAAAVLFAAIQTVTGVVRILTF